jgi:hypothetical protein
MIQPDFKKWNQTPDDLRRLATESEHPRTRERFLALYMIATGQANATQWAQTTDREDESIMRWVHTYNTRGPEALTYRNLGGRAPLLRRKRFERSSKSLKRRPQPNINCRATAGV